MRRLPFPLAAPFRLAAACSRHLRAPILLHVLCSASRPMVRLSLPPSQKLASWEVRTKSHALGTMRLNPFVARPSNQPCHAATAVSRMQAPAPSQGPAVGRCLRGPAVGRCLRAPAVGRCLRAWGHPSGGVNSCILRGNRRRSTQEERIFIELVTSDCKLGPPENIFIGLVASDRKLKASREGSK